MLILSNLPNQSERRRRQQGYSAELDELRDVEADRLDRITRDHDREMKDISEKSNLNIQDRQRRNDKSNENWQRERLEIIREELDKKEQVAIKTLREQSSAELNMVLTRLETQSASEVQGLTDDGEGNIDMKRDQYEKERVKVKEEETVMMSRYALEREKEDLAKEEVSENQPNDIRERNSSHN